MAVNQAIPYDHGNRPYDIVFQGKMMYFVFDSEMHNVFSEDYLGLFPL